METLREEKMFDNAILLQEIEPTQTDMHVIATVSCDKSWLALPIIPAIIKGSHRHN